MPTLILASGSPARTKLLTDAGIAHDVVVSDVDEPAVIAANPDAGPAEAALLLARAKAEAVAATVQSQDALVVGCDSIFELDGEPFGKPHTADVARERITAMSGRTGTLHTGHWLVDTRKGTGTGRTASATVTFEQLTDQEIEAYIATGEPLAVAGSFTLDGRGGAFIREVHGDPHTVIGLSISTLRDLLKEAGVEITDLWA